jgi:2-hydroxychromene-2-carboxylate isomerase
VTWEFAVGRGHQLATRLFRDAFQAGHELSIEAHVLAAASAAGLDRGDARDAMRDPAIKARLREATEAAYALGVFGVPTVDVAGELFWGDDRLEQAAAHAVSVGRAA